MVDNMDHMDDMATLDQNSSVSLGHNELNTSLHGVNFTNNSSIIIQIQLQ